METEEGPNLEDLVQENGKNKKKVVCSFCPSVILTSGDGLYFQIKFPLPVMKRRAGTEEIVEDDLTNYWKVENMFDFQNVGFSNTVDKNGLKKYLICAECEMGPIGFHDTETKISYVSLIRVKHIE